MMRRACDRLEQAVFENVFFFFDDGFDLIKDQFFVEAPLVVLVVLLVSHAFKFFEVEMSPEAKHFEWYIFWTVTQTDNTKPMTLMPVPYILIEHISSQVPLISCKNQKLYQ